MSTKVNIKPKLFLPFKELEMGQIFRHDDLTRNYLMKVSDTQAYHLTHQILIKFAEINDCHPLASEINVWEDDRYVKGEENN